MCIAETLRINRYRGLNLCSNWMWGSEAKNAKSRMWTVIVFDRPGLPWLCSSKLVLLLYVFFFCSIALWIWAISSVLKRRILYHNPKDPEVSEQVCLTSRGKSILPYLPLRLLENRLLFSPSTPRVNHGCSICEENPEDASFDSLG